jgi:pyruvate formate lyase activating enzyme
LQHGLFLLPELGHFEIASGSGERARCTPETVPELALAYGCDSIAFTYNEPTIWGEYIIDICRVAESSGLKTVMVSNGYITRDAFHDIYDYIDAANTDLKAFTENFYGKITLRRMQPVLDALLLLKKETPV